MISSLFLSMTCAQTRSAFVAWKTGFHPRIKSEGMLFRIML